MRQTNGKGSAVAMIAVFGICAVAECLPLALLFLAVAVAGVAWDFARGHVA